MGRHHAFPLLAAKLEGPFAASVSKDKFLLRVVLVFTRLLFQVSFLFGETPKNNV
jgi:hypothetical protein